MGHIFHSKFNAKARGTAIIIHKKIQFSPSNVIADPQGRYIMVSGKLLHTQVLLVNVYGPNWDKNFVIKLIAALPSFNSDYLILGGDLNCVMDPNLDRSNPKPQVPSKMANEISAFLNQTGCVDPWRFYNPHNKVFSYFSHVHHSYSRIDYFFIDKNLLPSVKGVEYSAIVESDHAPLLLDLSFPSNFTNYIWRLNPSLLSDESFCQHVSSSIDSFLKFNSTEQVSPTILWETLKVVLRGDIISYTSFINKERERKRQQLIETISKIDSQYSSSPTPELYKERIDLQTQYNLISSSQAEQLILRSWGFFYEHGDKAGRLLAHQLKSRASAQHISQIADDAGDITIDPLAINNIFMNFYSSLYKSETPKEQSKLVEFFDQISVPTISSEYKKDLEHPLQLQEISAAIAALQSGKTPGPDGFPIEFYKKFSTKLSPLLLNMFEHSLSQGTLPKSLTEALITLLLKPEKDPTQCSSYRPISLLNADVKVLAKLLAIRLESPLVSIISANQTGFIKGRHIFSNIRCLLNVLYTPPSQDTPEIVVSLDAEKAFDRVEWDYLFFAMERFGFGPRFIEWIRLLYTSPVASVVTNKCRSKIFFIKGYSAGVPIKPAFVYNRNRTIISDIKIHTFVSWHKQVGC